jgi:hypothetical protein
MVCVEAMCMLPNSSQDGPTPEDSLSGSLTRLDIKRKTLVLKTAMGPQGEDMRRTESVRKLV